MLGELRGPSQRCWLRQRGDLGPAQLRAVADFVVGTWR